MGKYILLITIAMTAGISLLTHQSHQTELDTDRRQAERQDKVIARQIARSGYNVVLARARNKEQHVKKVKQIVAAVGTVRGSYQGGAYKAWLTQISPTAYRVTAEGTYNAVTHRINVPYERNIVPSPPKVDEPSQLEVEFEDSMAGYCSAIYLQRFVPHTNNGHGNNKDGVDSSNPGKSKEGEDTDYDGDGEYEDDEINRGNASGAKYKKLKPELVFAPGNNRDGAQATFDQIIEPGTLLNFILAVDADHTCERRGDTDIRITDSFFDYTRQAFRGHVKDLSKLRETPYALTQEHPLAPGTWRVAFEDLIFSDDELWEVKENGYKGTGWLLDGDGFWQLEDYGDRPDFSDQVIEVKIVPAEDDGDELLAEEDGEAEEDESEGDD